MGTLSGVQKLIYFLGLGKELRWQDGGTEFNPQSSRNVWWLGISVMGGRKRQILGGYWPARLSYAANSRITADPVFFFIVVVAAVVILRSVLPLCNDTHSWALAFPNICTHVMSTSLPKKHCILIKVYAHQHCRKYIENCTFYYM